MPPGNIFSGAVNIKYQNIFNKSPVSSTSAVLYGQFSRSNFKIFIQLMLNRYIILISKVFKLY